MAERRFAGKVAFRDRGRRRHRTRHGDSIRAEVVSADIETVGNEEFARLVAEHGER